MSRSRALLRFGGGYGLAVVTGGVLSIAVIPVVILAAGEQSWATIAVAQAVGGFAFVFVAGGWGVTGPTATAALPEAERGQYYRDSVATRGWLFVAIIVPASAIAVLLTQDQPWLAAMTVAGGLMAALSAGWFYVGESSPIRFLLIDTLPRNAATVVGAIVLLATGDALWFVTAQFLGALLACVVATVDILRRYPAGRWIIRPISSFGRLRGQSSAITMAATAGVYVNLPIVIVQVFIPAATADYALAERMLRMTLYATRPFVQFSQGYVPDPDPARQSVRATRVTALALASGVLGGAAYAVGGPFASGLLSGGTLPMSLSLSIPLGVALAAMLGSQVTGFACLTAFGLTRTLAQSTVVGAVLGAITMVPAAIVFGVDGLAWALAASELAVLAVQLVKLRPHLTRLF